MSGAPLINNKRVVGIHTGSTTGKNVAIDFYFVKRFLDTLGTKYGETIPPPEHELVGVESWHENQGQHGEDINDYFGSYGALQSAMLKFGIRLEDELTPDNYQDDNPKRRQALADFAHEQGMTHEEAYDLFDDLYDYPVEYGREAEDGGNESQASQYFRSGSNEEPANSLEPTPVDLGELIKPFSSTSRKADSSSRQDQPKEESVKLEQPSPKVSSKKKRTRKPRSKSAKKSSAVSSPQSKLPESSTSETLRKENARN
jgi:hypothetical protein